MTEDTFERRLNFLMTQLKEAADRGECVIVFESQQAYDGARLRRRHPFTDIVLFGQVYRWLKPANAYPGSGTGIYSKEDYDHE